MDDNYTNFDNKLQEKHLNNIKNQTNRKYPFSYKYFENTDCEFFPCHTDVSKGHNCMFCRCPLYPIDACYGIQNGDGVILENGVKDCTNCTYNHEYENAILMSLA
jgi:Zn-finger protein